MTPEEALQTERRLAAFAECLREPIPQAFAEELLTVNETLGQEVVTLQAQVLAERERVLGIIEAEFKTGYDGRFGRELCDSLELVARRIRSGAFDEPKEGT